MEDELLKKFTSQRQIEKSKHEQLAKLYNEINTLKSLIEANDKKMRSDFEFWYQVMKKKLEYETKNGKIELIKTNNSLTNSVLREGNDLQHYSERFNKTRSMIMTEINKN